MYTYLTPSHSSILNSHILVSHYIYNYLAVSLIASISLTGLLTFPVPSNVKAENFTLVNKTSIANNVTHFNKSEKSQLEHVFLRTLCKSGLKQLVTNKGRRSLLQRAWFLGICRHESKAYVGMIPLCGHAPLACVGTCDPLIPGVLVKVIY